MVRKIYGRLYPAESPDQAQSRHWFTRLTEESWDSVQEISE